MKRHHSSVAGVGGGPQVRHGYAMFCRATAVIFGLAFLYLASGTAGAWSIVLFTLAVVLSWAWLSSVSLHLYDVHRRPTDAEPATQQAS